MTTAINKKHRPLMVRKFDTMLLGGTLTMMVVSVLLMSDSVIAGIFIGSNAAAGVNLVTPIYSISAFFGSIFSLGVPIRYSLKMGQFDKGLHEYVEGFNYNGWIPFKEEYDFEFVFNNRAIIHGFIDAILINAEGDLKCIDFKTSKKPFPDNKIPTSQQFSIYCMGMLNDFGKLPIQCDYKFILLNQEQNALTTGFAKRIVKKLNNVLDNIDKNSKSGVYIPSPTPLCWYCPYNKNNPKNKDFKDECEYYSLWSPTDKRWDVNKRFNTLDLTNDKHVNNIEDDRKEKKQRKMIF